jgi:hypothetical protein
MPADDPDAVYVLPPKETAIAEGLRSDLTYAIRNVAVCHRCDADLPLASRCDGCAMTRVQNGKLRGARLVRW